MSVIKFLNEFTTDSMLGERTSRRQLLGKLGSFGKQAAFAAVPLGLATMPEKTYANYSRDSHVGALQFALTLEYLEDEFYRTGLGCDIIPTGGPETVFMQISKHETAHVAFLIAGLEGAGVEPVAKPEFDFTAGGLFDPFNLNGTGKEVAYAQFLALSQAFEDTGVRAYKGQATNLMGTDFLTPALQIHSVEARHASEVRRLRGLNGWITSNDRGEGMPEQTQSVYDGEENVIQGGVDVTTLGDGSPFSTASSTEAYDEPLAKEDVLAIASLFIKA